MIGRSIQTSPFIAFPAGRRRLQEGEDYWDEGNKGDTETMEEPAVPSGTAGSIYQAFAHTLYKSGQSFFTFRRINFDQPGDGDDQERNFYRKTTIPGLTPGRKSA